MAALDEVGLLEDLPLDHHVGRQLPLQLVEHLSDLGVEHQRVRVGLLLHGQDDGRAADDLFARP